MEQKKILVLGGAGFIGSYVNKLLASQGYQTIVFDNLSHGKKEMVCRGLFIEGDIGNRSNLEKVFSTHKIDAVMHFAALIDVGESTHTPALYYKNNVVDTLTVLNTMLHYQVKTFIFSSSAAVYGNPQTEFLSESHPCNPINPYGQTKLMVEKILFDYHQAYGLKYCAFRYFNAAGGDPEGEIKNTKPKESNLIPVLLRSLKDPQKEITLFGTDYPTPDGTCIRDYIHIHDLGTAHISAMEKLLNDSSLSAIYNLGNGHGYSVRQVIAAVNQVTGKQVKVIEGPRRAGDPPYLVALANKANQELQWKPRYSLEEMILHAWQAL